MVDGNLLCVLCRRGPIPRQRKPPETDGVLWKSEATVLQCPVAGGVDADLMDTLVVSMGLRRCDGGDEVERRKAGVWPVRRKGDATNKRRSVDRRAWVQLR